MSVPLTATAGPVEFWPPALQPVKDSRGKITSKGKPKVSILIRVPTLMERDSFSAALVRGGVVHYSKRQMRDLLMAGLADKYEEKAFTKLQEEFEELFVVSDAEEKMQIEQMKRLQELNDVPDGEEPPEPDFVQAELDKIKPDAVMDRKVRVRLVAIQQDIMSTYPPLQKAFADLAEQDARRAWLQAEIYITGWKGLKHDPDGNGRGGLQKHEAEYLRREIGKDAWEEASDFITALHGIDGDEEKNLASLLASTSAQTGSKAPASKASSGSGASTDETSEAIPDGESAKTTASS